MNAIEAGNTVSIRDIAIILYRRRWLSIITFFLVIAATIVITIVTPRQYQSHMKILVKNERPEMIVSAGSDSQSRPDEVTEAEINSEIELLNGTNLLRSVVTKSGLDRLQKGYGAGTAARDRAIEQAASRLQHDLKIASVHKANIIEVDYMARDPHLAAAVLRQLADSYLEEHLKVHGTPGTYEFFASQAQHYQSQFQAAQSQLEQFRQQHNIVMLAQQKDAMLQRTSESEAALLQADAAIGEYTHKIADTRRQLTTAQPRVITQSKVIPNQYSVERLSTMLADLQNRRTQLLAKFRPDDRLVQEAEKEIADTQTALDNATKATASEQSTDINPIRQTLEMDVAKQEAELAGVEARRQALARQVDGYSAQLTALGNATAEYDNLTRAENEAEETYLLYNKKAEEARIAESLDRQKISNVAIADPPTETQFPSKPNVKLNAALGGLLAVFLGIGVALGFEYLQQTMQAVRQVELNAQPSIAAGFLIDAVERGSDLETLKGLPVLATLYLPRQPQS